jgi:hypothetical protein
MRNTSTATYNLTSFNIQMLLNLSGLNGTMLVMTLLILFSGCSNIISLFYMFIGGFERIIGKGFASSTTCMITVVFFAFVLGLAIFVMTMQVPTYNEDFKRIREIHKAARYLSVIDGLLSGAGYLEMVTTTTTNPVTMIFHYVMAILIAIAIPLAYEKLSKHIRLQYQSVIKKFNDNTLTTAQDVGIKAFETLATTETESMQTDEEKMAKFFKINKAV